MCPDTKLPDTNDNDDAKKQVLNNMFCPKCGLGNPDTAQFCEGCGNKLPTPNYGSVQLGKDGYSSQPSYSNKDYYEAFIGEKNQHYYLQKFQQFDRDGKTSITWHWPAFFVAFYWMLYRKMWLNAFLYFISPYLALFVGGIIIGVLGAVLGEHAASSLSVLLVTVFYIGIFVVPAMYANTWYYKHAKKKIAETEMYANNPQKRFGILAGRGGTGSVVLFIILFFGLVAMIGIMAAIAIPAYQDYVNKSKNVQAYSIGKQASDAVATYYLQHHKAPTSLGDTTFNTHLPQSIQDVKFDDQAGVVVVELRGQSAEATSSRLIFTPHLEDNQNVLWTCSSEGIKPRQLPKDCQ